MSHTPTHHPEPVETVGVKSIVGGIIMAITMVFFIIYLYATGDTTPATPSRPDYTSASQLAATQSYDPNGTWCSMPCRLRIYGNFKPLPPPGVSLIIIAPLAEDGSKTYTFHFDGKGNFTDEKGNPKPDDSKVWADNVGGGWYYFDTPGHTGLPMTIQKG